MFTILYILLLWSIIGIPLYQYFVLVAWFDNHADEIWISDIVKTIPFGFFVMLAVFILASMNKEQIKYK